jgi:hypothetical protein
MPNVLSFFKDNEIFIYILLGILVVWQLRKFSVAWDALRSAAFGLEQESARARLNWAAMMLLLLLILVVVEFGVVSFIVPAVPEASPLLTPTLDVLGSPDIEADVPQVEVTSPVSDFQVIESGCVSGFIDIISPQANETVIDVVEITGSANIPNFGFYKFEMASVDDPTWLTIQAGDVLVVDGLLGYWDTSRLSGGDYLLRLVVTDNQAVASPPCTIQLRVETPAGS